MFNKERNGLISAFAEFGQALINLKEKIMNKKSIVNKNSGIYFRSESNGWGLKDEFAQRKNGTYVLKHVKITKGVNEFKIADANWSAECNYGFDGNMPIMLYHNYALNNGSNTNIRMIAHNDYFVDIFLYKTDGGLTMRVVSNK